MDLRDAVALTINFGAVLATAAIEPGMMAASADVPRLASDPEPDDDSDVFDDIIVDDEDEGVEEEPLAAFLRRYIISSQGLRLITVAAVVGTVNNRGYGPGLRVCCGVQSWRWRWR